MSLLIVLVKTKTDGQSNRYTTVVISSVRLVALLQVGCGQCKSLDKCHVANLKVVSKETLLRFLEY
jgi:hypothetical protein